MIDVKNLSKSFGDHLVLDNISEHIHPGEKVRLTYANADEILKETYEESENLRRFSPEAIFLTICGNRKVFLGDVAPFELEYFTFL